MVGLTDHYSVSIEIDSSDVRTSVPMFRPKPFCGRFNVSSKIQNWSMERSIPPQSERVAQKYPHILFKNLLAFFSVS